MYLPWDGIFQGIVSIVRTPHNKATPCLWLELIVHDWFVYLTFFLQLFQIFNKQTVHLCMCRWRVHLPICQDPPGAQADGVRQGHPPTEREPKRQSRHTFRQWRWYQVSPADGCKNTPLKMGKQKRPKTTSQGEEKKKLWGHSFSSPATTLCIKYQDKIKVCARSGCWPYPRQTSVRSPFAGGSSMRLKRPTRRVISSGWARTAGAQRSPR